MNRRHAFLLFLMAISAGLMVWTSQTTPPPPPAPELTPPTTVHPLTHAPDTTSKNARGEPSSTPHLDDDVVISQNFPNLGCRRTVRQGSDGEERVKLSCGQLSNPALNTHAKRSTEELEKLAQTDAQAAQMLAFRSHSMDRPRTLKYVVRAVALGNNDTTPLLWYMSEIKPAPTFSLEKSTSLDGDKLNYVLSGVAESLGSRQHFARHEHWRSRLVENGLEAGALAELDQHQARMLEEIERIQYEAGIAPTTAE